MTWDTAGNIINDAMTEVGLGSVADPYGSNDPNFRMARALLKSGGRALVRDWEWTHLRAEHTFTTVQGQSEYDFPAGFRNMMDQTAWNRTNRLPVGGPLSPQEWQYLKSRLTGVVFTVLFRMMNQKMVIYPDTNTPGGYDIAYEYLTYNWISVPATSDTLTLDAPADKDSLVWFDPHLMSRRLKRDFLAAKKLDTTSAEREYQIALDAAKGDNINSPVLVAGRPRQIDPLIGGHSIPFTGFGS